MGRMMENKLVMCPSFTIIKGDDLPLTLNYRFFTENGEDEKIAKKAEIIEHVDNPDKVKIKGASVTIPFGIEGGLYYYTGRYNGTETTNKAVIFIDKKYVSLKGRKNNG